MTIAELPTPAAVVDLDRVERNTQRMAARVSHLGARLRPHVKTHKCVEAARLQTRGHFGGLTVSTLAEARGFADAGFRDLTYAVPLAPARMHEALALARQVDRLNLLVDSEAALLALEACARQVEPLRERLGLFLKVDCGYHRAGVDPGRPETARLAARMASSTAARFRGLLTHAGHAYGCRSRAEIAVIAAAERRVMVELAARLRTDGIDVPEVSIGSTPTLAVADDLTGVTEVRPGNYVYFDLFQAQIGSCGLDDIAFSVVASVIGRYPERGQLAIDAGALALSKDGGATHIDPDAGFGLASVVGDPVSGNPPLRLRSLSQEHGMVTAAAGTALPATAIIGARLRVLPNHACLAAAQFDRVHVARGDEVVGLWQTVRGW